MTVTINLFTVTKKTSFDDVIRILDSIETASLSFNRVAARHLFIVGCLNACGFKFWNNFASSFPRHPNVSANNAIYRLPYSCSYGRWNMRHCFDVDISSFK